MTIAAGVICSDGIILCADSEQSLGEHKFQHDKIFTFEDCLIVTGAGATGFIRMAFDKLCDEYKGARPVNASDARDIVEKVVRNLYAEHIFKFYQPSDPQRPVIEMVVATRCGEGKLALVKTSETAAYLSDSYEVPGIGQPMFEYWASYLYRPNLTMNVMSYLVFFMLREAKKNQQGCGGFSLVKKLCVDPKQTPMVHRVYDENRILADFPESVTRILSVCMDPSVPDQWIEEKLREFSQQVLAIRASEKHNAEIHHISRQPTSPPPK
jgi:20S proteasome alpha/beta subunit